WPVILACAEGGIDGARACAVWACNGRVASPGGSRRLDPPYTARPARDGLLQRRRVGLEDSTHPTSPYKSHNTARGQAMPNYRRNYVPGGTYFFTVVAHERRPLFDRDQTRALLREAFQVVRAKRPFVIVATVLLPDHLHCVWTLPEGDAQYSTRWRRIKD